jgi:predicted DsbA family dithiol-disulfide isomerase
MEKAGRIKIEFYTDPLCCWSWAFEKQWQRFVADHREEISYEYIMGGMIPHWQSYNDPLNSVSKPIQMGPIWMHASEVTQVKMKYSIWHEDPPSSSYPASIAVKTARIQSKQAAEKYLYESRRTMMDDGMNISKPEVLLAVAKSLDGNDLDYTTFEKDWNEGNGKEAFRQDLQKAKYHSIGRFPTLTFQNSEGKGVLITGYRPHDELEKAFDHVRTLAAT